MLFREKVESPAAAPAPAAGAAVRCADGEPDLRGLGRVLWRKKTLILGVHAVRGRRRLRRRQRDHAALPLRSARCCSKRAKTCSCAPKPTRHGDRATIDPEAVTSQVQVVLSRDLAREVIKKEKLADNPEFDPPSAACRRCARSSACSASAAIPSKMTQGRAHAGGLLRPAQRLRGRQVARDRHRFLVGQSRSCRAQSPTAIAETYLEMQQAAKQDQTRAAGNWLAGEIEKMRTQGGGRGGQGRGVSRAVQSVRRLQQYVAAEPAAHRDQFADRGRARPEGRSGGEGAAVARADPLRQADRILRHRQFRIDAPADRAAHRAALRSSPSSRRRLLDQHPRIKELKAQIAEIDRQIQQRRRAAGAPARKRRQARRRPRWRR